MTNDFILNQQSQAGKTDFHELMAVCPVGLFHINRQGNTIYANDQVYTILGIEKKNQLNPQWYLDTHPDDREHTCQLWEQMISTGEEFRSEHRYLQNNNTIWTNIQIKAIRNTTHHLIGFIGTITDVTWQRAAQERLRQQQEELAQVARLTLVGEMVASLTHEVSQPLAASMNYLAAGLQQCSALSLPQEITDMFTDSYEQLKQAGTILHRLRLFYTKGEMKKDNVNINGLLQDVLALQQITSQKKGTRFDIHYDTSIPDLHLDRVQIQLVLLNILRNSLEALDEQDIENPCLSVNTQQLSQQYIEIKICDNGPGIPASHVKRIFAPFFTTKSDGMGIGLSMCKSIVEAHHGTINLQANQPSGVCVVIHFPIQNETSEK